MRLATVRDLGLHVRERRHELSMTQSDLATAAGVSRRWLSDLEAGKATAEIGLILRTLDALGLVLDVSLAATGQDGVDLDELLRDLGSRRG
jgi:HTH-type transcriptional regulator/antitoxin HipB